MDFKAASARLDEQRRMLFAFQYIVKTQDAKRAEFAAERKRIDDNERAFNNILAQATMRIPELEKEIAGLTSFSVEYGPGPKRKTISPRTKFEVALEELLKQLDTLPEDHPERMRMIEQLEKLAMGMKK